MSNGYYTYISGQPPTQQRALSAAIRAEFTSISSGFDAVQTAIQAVASGGLTGLLPDQTNNSGRPLISNGATAQWSQAVYFDPITNRAGFGTTAPTCRSTFSDNTNVLPTPFAGTVIHESSATGSPTFHLLDAFAAGSAYLGRSANGNALSPSSLVNGSLITGLGGLGYGATHYSNPIAFFNCYAAETWTDASNGCYWDLFITAKGSVIPARALRVDNDGSVLIGTTTNNGAQKLQVVGGFGVDTIAAINSITVNGAAVETLNHATGTFATITNLATTTATANTALTNAATAQTAANAAQTTANTGVTNAATAQATANAAGTAAGVAQTAAGNAQTSANTANTAIAALNTAAVHLAGTETITGAKTFQVGAEPTAKNIPKLWCMFNGTSTGTNAPLAGVNVTSVTRNGVGDYTINFAITLSTANYGCFPSVGYSVNPGVWAVIARNVVSNPQTTTSVRIITTISGGNVDAEIIAVQILCA